MTLQNREGKYKPRELSVLLRERVMCGRRKGSRARASVQAIAALNRPTVRLFRTMAIVNPCAPDAKMFLRAFPFRGQRFYGIQREVGVHGENAWHNTLVTVTQTFVTVCLCRIALLPYQRTPVAGRSQWRSSSLRTTKVRRGLDP